MGKLDDFITSLQRSLARRLAILESCPAGLKQDAAEQVAHIRALLRATQNNARG